MTSRGVAYLAAGFACAAALAAPARAEVAQCHVVSVQFTPLTAPVQSGERHEPSQIVAWVEKTPPAGQTHGEYVDTIYITAQTGRYGLGNRPGRWDFNSGPMFPYGRRNNTFPVWAHQHGQGPEVDGMGRRVFPAVVFQNCCGTPQCGHPATDDPAFCSTLINDSAKAFPCSAEFEDCGENNLSHPFQQSSREPRYCQPLLPNDPDWMQADAMSCATVAYTDKGKFSTTATSLYPPRTDLIRGTPDSPSVEQFKAMNPFDAVSRATPMSGELTTVSWPIPPDLGSGDFVVWVEVAQAFDHNATYSTATYPAPPSSGPKRIAWSGYGLPHRGQPSVLYRVPFTIGSTVTVATTADYAGYSDPEGLDGAIRSPDATITADTPGSGASRLQLLSDGGAMYRVRVEARPELDFALPGAPDAAQVLDIQPTAVTLRFAAPGDDGLVGEVTGYEIRYRANAELTEDNFASGIAAAVNVTPAPPGQLQTVELTGLLPETDYWIGIRAFDDCHNLGPVTIVELTTADRPVGEVDACFIATAAYGSRLANDVELLRHVRDALLDRTVLGELAIETYYTFSPAVAGVVGESELLRSTVRAAIAPIVRWVRGLSF